MRLETLKVIKLIHKLPFNQFYVISISWNWLFIIFFIFNIWTHWNVRCSTRCRLRWVIQFSIVLTDRGATNSTSSWAYIRRAFQSIKVDIHKENLPLFAALAACHGSHVRSLELSVSFGVISIQDFGEILRNLPHLLRGTSNTHLEVRRVWME